MQLHSMLAVSSVQCFLLWRGQEVGASVRVAVCLTVVQFLLTGQSWALPGAADKAACAP